uniref:Uncharacterized protein n=1 Tax=Setaria viridis TaxID=4556 RepID=A0A4U6TGQ4_SETVI|nr:hypothetical protein SEVIR_8G186400v2 [Setaria viridis]
MLEEAEMPKGSMANLDCRTVERKAFNSVHRCLLVLTDREHPSLRASHSYSPLPLQLHVQTPAQLPSSAVCSVGVREHSHCYRISAQWKSSCFSSQRINSNLYIFNSI